MKLLQQTTNALISLFYPPLCEGCGADVESGTYLCSGCYESAPRIRPPFCERCSEPFGGQISEKFTCANCADRVLHFNAAVAAYRSRGVVRKLLHEFKYGKKSMHLRYPLSCFLFEVMSDARLQGQPFDALVPVPLHPARERDRGFNQAMLLGEILSARTQIPLRPVLERVRYTKTQTAFDRAERMKNLRNAFRLRTNADVQNWRVLLLDDVLTTGSTLSECARVLRKAGALSVHAVTAARA